MSTMLHSEGESPIRGRILPLGILAAGAALTMVWWWQIRDELGYTVSRAVELESPRGEFLPLLGLLGGLAASIVAAALIRSLVAQRDQARGAAGRSAARLQQAQGELERLRLVASRTPGGVILSDAAGNIEWVNAGFTRIYGYRLEDVRGRRPETFLDGPETSPATRKAISDAIGQGRPFKGEILEYTRTGEKIWVELEIQPVNEAQGRRCGFMALQLDITACKRVEEEMRIAKDAAEQLNQQLEETIGKVQEAAVEAHLASIAKSQFLAMMSHEIRTPMNGVIGMTSLLLDSPLTRDQRDYAETIRVSGEALLTIINDILDFSKIESGRFELEQAEFSLRECVEEALDLLAPKAAEKRIDLLYEIADGAAANLRGDPTRVRQILVNLAGNALKFTERGEVVLSVRSQAVDPQNVELTFSVKDTGIGIPKEAIGRLFQSFTQVDASTTRRYGGTGLGLAISRRLAEMMGGRMWVESEPGRGSTFSFTIRIEAVPAKPKLYTGSSRVTLDGRRLLIVDDNATSRRILSDLARKWGMQPVAMEFPQEALEAIRRRETFDVAILDMQMPEMDGSMLAREIRRLRTPAELPMVMLSSLGRREETAHLFDANLSKPIKPNQLYEAFVRIFRRGAESVAPMVPVPPVLEACYLDRILLAEDNTVNQKVALHMLHKLGYRADVAANGLEVLAAVNRQPYDIILMDVQMPEMDGLEAARRIAQARPNRPDRPWMIALTANAMDGDREACLTAGMDDYLRKPIRADDLLAAIRRARTRDRALVEEIAQNTAVALAG